MLAGCSGALRFAYENADAFARWKADSFLQLSGADSEELDDRIDAFHLWHRAHALPQYAKLAEDAARRLERGLSQADVVWGYDSLVAQGKESARAAAERIAPLLDRVGAEQSRHIERGFADDNRRFAKEHLRGSDEDKRRRRIKRTVERIEDWVGGLSDAQLARVHQYAERVPAAEELRARDRVRMQAGILEIVRSGHARERLADFLLAWEAGRDPAYVAANEAWRREAYALALDIDRMLSPEQRARAVARLRGYAADFAALSQKRLPH